MPPTRRIKFFAIAVGLIVLSILYITSNARRSNQQFYDRTVAELNAKIEKTQAGAAAADAEITQKLKEAQERVRAEVKAEAEAREGKARDVVRDRKDGEKTKEAQDETRKPPDVKGGEKWDTGKEVDGAKDSEKTTEQKEVELELNSILKRSPIIIFSKSYCPFSRKAKAVFAKYTIVPAPFIVELDEHALGARLQAKLLDSTGRRTVPNILISGKSIGGGDDVEALHRSGELIEKIKAMGGKRMIEVALTDTS